MHPLVKQVQAAGVVGAGGAGFPAHTKYSTRVDTFLANGAECEPLLAKDEAIMLHYPEEMTKGLNLVADAVGAQKRILGIKGKHKKIIGQFNRIFAGNGCQVFEMGDYYPAGDEYVLVYEATGRLIPYGGYPVDIGCVVSNVETLLNVGLASMGVPVTEKFITIAGAVKNPVTLKVPVGTPVQDIIKAAGGPTVSGEIAALDGGAMMGELLTDFSRPVTKTSGGYIILPADHHLIRRRNQSIPEIKKIGQSACDQCNYCTDFCPRFLLGYEIHPHKVMRSLGFAGEKDDFWGKYAVNCCECNLCSLYACPEDLDPKQACVRSKRNLKLKEIQYTPPEIMPQAHPMQTHRKVSIFKLTRKLGLTPYDVHADFEDIKIEPDQVRLPLSQHIGQPAQPIVKVGDMVRIGQLIGEVPERKPGANVHASINGRVRSVENEIVIESA